MAVMAQPTRMPTVFASLDPPPAWPRPRWVMPDGVLERSLSTLPGVGAALERKLRGLGLATVGDLLLHRPRRYEEAAPRRAVADLFGEEEVVLSGRVTQLTSRRTARRLTIQKALVEDGGATVTAVWFNQPWLAERLLPGTAVRLRGQLRRGEFHVRAYDLEGGAATADFAPVYPASEEVPARRLRELVEAALPLARGLLDPLPAGLAEREGLP
ncbi:MAG: hypothetical protein H0T39_05090, partial [Actinobacteria bacterium]|nr:hypothetical protein [Actinomycetota bacterium]